MATSPPTATLSMSSIESTLSALVDALPTANYDKSFAQYRFWLNIGSEHADVNVQDQIDDAIRRLTERYSLTGFIHPTVHLLIRFIGDLETDQAISRHVKGLRMRQCTSKLRSFFSGNFDLLEYGVRKAVLDTFLTDVNFIARWANLGYVQEETIRDHILQSLISHQTLYDHQANALIIFFKLAGATFGAYTDPSVIDRCFDLLEGCYGSHPTRARLLQVFPP
jgi:hypothetical protein